MKKVLFINTVFDGGGAAKIVRTLFDYTDKQPDVEAYFAYGRGKNVYKNRVYKFGIFFEVLFHIFIVRILGIDGCGTYFSTKRLINYIKKNKFDLVHLHNLHGYYLNYKLLLNFLNKLNIPIIWTLHDEWALTWLPAHSMGCQHCISAEGKCINRYLYPKTYNKIFANWSLKRKINLISSISNLTFVSPAKWLAKKVNLVYPKLTVKIIVNSVSFSIINIDKKLLREKYNLGQNKKIVLFSSGNLNDPNKGLKYIIKIASNLIKEKDIVFVLVGQGKKKKLSNIVYLGYLNEKQMEEVYALSDMYCFFSEAETMPLSLLEAKSAGLYIFSMDISASKEVLEDYERCFFVNNNSIFLLKDKILNLDINFQKRKNVRYYNTIDFCQEYFKIYLS
ncbi:MAG: glycosyltransferase [Candidatus Magasanikbacteria bacterium]